MTEPGRPPAGGNVLTNRQVLSMPGSDIRVRAIVDDASFRALADARREVWKGGFLGMMGGAALGAVVYQGVRASARLPWLSRSHALLGVLGGACVGGYIGSSMRGLAVGHTVSEVLEAHAPARSEVEDRARTARRQEQERQQAAAVGILAALDARNNAAVSENGVQQRPSSPTPAVAPSRTTDIEYKHDASTDR